ncbi:hypothetical protein MLD38_005540 [Melastoma candidum]|uniref:Uncharacterized protein n=1 Tax=Melastoma candidum TaxID=119954 RepID=A0ACB9RJD4_9MYRT|nr:hypothetical protein MLD38_005540 [Melastoma candidum]
MFGFNKSPANNLPPKHASTSDDFDLDDGIANNSNTLGRRTASEPNLVVPGGNNRKGRGASTVSASYSTSPATRVKYQNDFHDSGGFENQSVQELEHYAAYKAEETTDAVNNCLRIAEDIKGDATRTLDMLHQQGEQITRTHQMVADTEKDLSKGEKLLGNLGGMFSMTWKPKKAKEIKGPVIVADKQSKASEVHAQQREKLGLTDAKGKGTKTPPREPTNALQKVEMEKAKQDDALSDLSDILGDLKGMALDMGSELERQNKALDHLNDDVDELNNRVKGANQHTRRLLGK